MNRLETIKETNPEICVDREIAQAKHTLERYAKGPMFYKPHPFGWPFDAYVLRDALAKFAPNQHEIQVPSLASESQREAAGTADEKPDGQAENAEVCHPEGEIKL
jgi:hypothetical protein